MMGTRYTICRWAINRSDPQNLLSVTLDVPLQRTHARTRQLKTTVSVYGPSKRSRPDHCARKGRQSRIRVFGSGQSVSGRSAVPSLQPCYVWEFRGFLCLTFFVVSLLCNHNKILQGIGGESSIIPLSLSLSIALEFNGYFRVTEFLVFLSILASFLKTHPNSLSTGIQAPMDLGIRLRQELTAHYVSLESASNCMVS